MWKLLAAIVATATLSGCGIKEMVYSTACNRQGYHEGTTGRADCMQRVAEEDRIQRARDTQGLVTGLGIAAGAAIIANSNSAAAPTSVPQPPLRMCPNGVYVRGYSCRLMPNGQYVGQ